MLGHYQAPSDQVYVRCLNCGTDLTLPRSDGARRPFDPHCPKCGAELKLICEWCKKQHAPKLWRFGLDGLPKNRCCSQECQTLNWRAKNPDWKNRNRKEPARHLRTCEECGKEFLSHHGDTRFCSVECKNRKCHRDNPEPIRASRRKWHHTHREQSLAITRGWRERQAKKLVEFDRLKNVEGLDLKMGLRISLAAHAWLEGAESLYDMKGDIYPDSNDPFNAIKQLDRRFHAVIEDEKQRIAKLSDEHRRTEAEYLRARLSEEIAKPKKTPKK